MYETEDDLVRLQGLLDLSYDGAGAHLRSITTPARRIPAVEPKSKTSRRTLDLPAPVAEALHRHRGRQNEERLLAGWRWRDQWGLVFCTERGEPLTPNFVLRDLKRILREAGLPVVRFQDLRHSCASLLLLHGVPTRMVADILGHSSVGLTQQTYQHVVPELRAAAVKAQEAYLGG